MKCASPAATKPATPASAVRQLKGGRKRARMMADNTPDGPTPKKRKPPAKSRTLKDMLNTLGSSTEKESGKTIKKDQVTPDSCAKAEKEEKSAEKQALVASRSSVKKSQSDTVPSCRWGHSLCMVSGSEAVVIGGQGDKQYLSKDSIWHLNLDIGQWSVPDTTALQGPKPETRIGHTANYDPTVRSIYLYGGSKHKKWFNDVHVLDLDEWKWQVVKANGKAPTRAYHSATLYRHELWIFGGVYPRHDPQPDGCSNDIDIYSPIEESWYTPIVMGEKPAPRSGHSATLLQDRLVVFGGWDAPYCYNDLHILDMGLVEWSKPEVSGTPPSPRSWHASCALSGNRVLIHGGYDGDLALDDTFIFNLDTLTWTCVQLDNLIPARAGHTALCLPYHHGNGDKDEVVIFAGGDNDGTFFQDLLDVMVPF